jgi:hypothetical protein
VAGAKDAEAARFIVGTNNPSAASRPFAVAFTPDGKTLLVTNFRANNLSFVDVDKALARAGRRGARLALATPMASRRAPRHCDHARRKVRRDYRAPRVPTAACCGVDIAGLVVGRVSGVGARPICWRLP